MIKVKCKWSNVWTSKGQLFHGEEAELPEAEVKNMGDAVEILSKPKKAPKKDKPEKE